MAADNIESAVAIASLVVENRKLCEEIEVVKIKQGSLERELNSRRMELESMYKEFLHMERIKENALKELRDVQRERHMLLEEEAEREKRFDWLAEESGSIVLSLIATQGDLEERLERKTRALNYFSEKVVKMLRGLREMVCEDLEGGDVEMDGGHEVDEGMEMMIQPFVAQVQEIEKGLMMKQRFCF